MLNKLLDNLLEKCVQHFPIDITWITSK